MGHQSPKKKRALAASAPLRTKAKVSSKTVKDLPVEVLESIFKFLYRYTMVGYAQTPHQKAFPGGVYRDEPCTLDMQDYHCDMWQPQPLKKLKRARVVSFIYHLHRVSAVCRLWRDVIQSIPEYWTCIVVIINQDAPFSGLKRQITRTKDLPLDVRVTYSSNDDTDDDDNNDSPRIEQEKSQAQKAMKLLAPLIYRCRSFVFDLKYSSSLPFISQDFRGTADHLRVLELKCKLDNRNVQCPQVPTINPKDEFIFPRLSTVVLDGCTFMDACNVPSWTRQMKDMYLDTLSISRLAPPEPNEDDEESIDFDMYAFTAYLANIGYIRHLTLAHIDVAYDPGTQDSGGNQLRVDNLTLEGQDQPWVEEFNSITFGSSFCYFHLTDSSIKFESMTMTHHLCLERVEFCEYGFKSAIERHFGNRLDFYDCEALADDYLEIIAKSCPLLRRLYIINCPNITVQGLKAMLTTRDGLVDDDDEEDEEDRLVNGRNTSDDSKSIVELTEEDDELMAAGYDGHSYTSFKPIHRLHVTGHPRKLSKADRQWFKKRLENFSWN